MEMGIHHDTVDLKVWPTRGVLYEYAYDIIINGGSGGEWVLVGGGVGRVGSGWKGEGSRCGGRSSLSVQFFFFPFHLPPIIADDVLAALRPGCF